MMNKVTLFLFAFLFSLQAVSQSGDVIDSLKRNIDNYPAKDSFRVKAIYQYLAENRHNAVNDLPYITEMLDISRRIDYSYGIRKGWSMAVKHYGESGDFQQSFTYADSLLTVLKTDSSAAAKSSMAILYWDMADNYSVIGDYYKSIEYYLLAISVFEKLDSKKNLGSLYGNLSNDYNHISDSVKALEYVQKALGIADELGDDALKCATLFNYANNLQNEKQFSKAEEMLNSAEPIVQRLKNPAYSQYYFYLKGAIELYQDRFTTALPYLKKSLQFAKVTSGPHQNTGVMSLLFDCYLGMNNLPEAKVYLDSTLLIAEKAGLRNRRKEVYDGLAVWYEKKGDFKNSSHYLKKSMALNDSILSDENNKRVASLEMRYQVASKEREIQGLKTERELQQLSIRQKNVLNYILIGTALTILVISLLAYRNYKHKQKLQQQRISELETEKQLAATEAVLKGEEKERSRLAKDLHDGLGGMLSGIKYSFSTMKENLVMTPENQRAFERSMDMLDSSISEMRRVAHNMMPESLVKFGLDTALRDFCNDINQSRALQVNYQSIGLTNAQFDQTTAITVYRVVQELINNTLKHAAARTAIVQLAATGNQLSVTVEDDGKGFDTSILKQSLGIGWSNIRSRIEFLKGKLDVNSQPGKGTSVMVEVPV